MKIARIAIVAAMMLALAGIAAGARAQDDDFDVGAADPDLPLKIKKWNGDCVACHSEQGVANPPREGLDLAKLANLAVDPAQIEASVHAGLACKDCHGDNVVDYPHTKGPVKSCPDCHKVQARKIIPEFQKTLHYLRHSDSFTCDSCHNAHAQKKPLKMGSLEALATTDNAQCLDCHGSELRYSQFFPHSDFRYTPTMTLKRRPNLVETHSWLPNPTLHWRHVRCIDCHTVEVVDGVSHEILPKDRMQRKCGACHSQDSSLQTRLYRYLVTDERMKAVGFANAFILNDAYVVGATRNRVLDIAAVVVFCLLVGGLAIHGAIRILTVGVRKGRK